MRWFFLVLLLALILVLPLVSAPAGCCECDPSDVLCCNDTITSDCRIWTSVAICWSNDVCTGDVPGGPFGPPRGCCDLDPLISISPDPTAFCPPGFMFDGCTQVSSPDTTDCYAALKLFCIQKTCKSAGTCGSSGGGDIDDGSADIGDVCSESEDCISGYCGEDGYCEPDLPDPCECPSGYCDSEGNCVVQGCEEDGVPPEKPCPSGLECTGGSCQPPSYPPGGDPGGGDPGGGGPGLGVPDACNDSSDCPPGAYCGPNGTCEQPCDPDSPEDCPPGAPCSPTEGVCKPPPDLDCGDKTECPNGQSDCISGFVCRNWCCEPLPVEQCDQNGDVGNCNNKIDDDWDTFTDFDDLGCEACKPLTETCGPTVTCGDGIDNDGDGKADCFDSDCAACIPEESCNATGTCWDEKDNDCDGKLDYSDYPACNITDCSPPPDPPVQFCWIEISADHLLQTIRATVHYDGFDPETVTGNLDCGNGVFVLQDDEDRACSGGDCDFIECVYPEGGPKTISARISNAAMPPQTAYCQTGETIVPPNKSVLFIEKIETLPSPVLIGSKDNIVRVTVSNESTGDCSDGIVSLDFFTETGQPLSIPRLQRTELFLPLGSTPVDFAFDAGSLEPGIYRVTGMLYCPSAVFRDEKTVFFPATTEQQAASIPETGFLAIAIVAIVSALLLYNRKTGRKLRQKNNRFEG